MSIESNTNNATHLNIYKCSFHFWHIIIVKHVRHSINKRISRQNNEKALLVDLVCKAMHIPLNHPLYIYLYLLPIHLAFLIYLLIVHIVILDEDVVSDCSCGGGCFTHGRNV